VIFLNPSGAPELACDACGCRWFDRIKGSCYECGTPMDAQGEEAFREALAQFAEARQRAKETACKSGSLEPAPPGCTSPR